MKLTFPEALVRVPVLARLARTFDVEPNIRRANVEEDQGWIICELDGAAAAVEAAVDWLRDEGVRVDLLGDVLGELRPQRSRSPGGFGHLPAGRGDPPGLVEDAAVGAGERQRLVGAHLAALELVVAPGASA